MTKKEGAIISFRSAINARIGRYKYICIINRKK